MKKELSSEEALKVECERIERLRQEEFEKYLEEQKATPVKEK